MQTISIRSNRREEFIDMTALVEKEVLSSGIKDGAVILTSLHTTGGLTINENADPSVVEDILNTLSKIAPHKAGYSHSEGNSDAHIKTSLIGTSLYIIIRNGELVLGTWQGIFFCEFDGPRSRNVAIEVIPSKK